MKFMLTFSIKSEGAKRDEAITRFQKTGGMPPKEAKLNSILSIYLALPGVIEKVLSAKNFSSTMNMSNRPILAPRW
jgi:hypothetical protein